MKRIFVLLGVVFFSAPAIAGDPVNFATPLLALDGKQKRECVKLDDARQKCVEEIDVTLGWLSKLSLDMPDRALTTSDIVKRGALVERIGADKTIELSVDEAKIIKDQLTKLDYSSTIKFQALRLIDPLGVK